MNSETIKGFKDYTGEEALKRAEIRKIIQEQFELYGFEPAETPVIEYEEFVCGENANDEAVSDTFKLQDRGKRKLALRYELTFPLKRISQEKKLPYKRYQIGEVFRDEPVSSERFREFTQCDADIIGSTIKDEAELLALVSKIMKKLEIKQDIFINNRKLLNEILEENRIKEKDKEQVLREIDKLDKLSEKEIITNLKKYNAKKILGIIKKPESFFKKYKSYQEIEDLKKFCKIYGVNVKFKPSIVRGLSYYNGSVFEVKSSLKETITAGGSYMINNVQSTGISFGLERLSVLSNIKPAKKQILILSISQDKESIKLAENLREKGINTQLWTDKGISKALDYANSKSIDFVIFLGKEELKKKKFKLRDMKTGKEKMIEEKELAKIIGKC